MSDNLQPDADLAIAHVLFIDIVAYSKLAIDQQKEAVQELNHHVRNSEQFRRADAVGKLVRIPTGDGVALAFFTSPDAPVRCAIEVSKAVRNSSALQLRMGIHSGPVDQLSDVNERSNLAGTGLNMAQRIMNCGDAGHILLSQRVADDLVQYTKWRSQLNDLGEVELKHGVRVSVVNLYTDEVGNPEVPQSLRRAVARKPIEKARVPVRSQRLLATVCISCTALVMSLRFVPALPVLSHVWGHEQRLQDWLHRTGRRTATHPELVFVGLSTKSLAGPESGKAAKDRMLQLMAEHPFPWSREVWARLLDRLFESGARLVISDFLFDSHTNEGDQLFRAALDRYRERVVIGANFDPENGNEFVAPNADLIPPPAQYDDRVGYVNYWIDKQDGMLRAARFFTSNRQLAGQKPSQDERPYVSLVARAMEKLGRSKEVPHDLQDHLIRFSAADAYQPYPIWEIADPDMWHSKYSDGEFFEDKIVIVGPSAPKLGDVIDNPISSEIKGPVMHLNALAATMDHEFLRKLPVALDLVIVAVFGLLAWLLLGCVGRWLCLLSFLGLSVAYLLLAFLLYNFLGIFVPIFPPLMTLLGCGFVGFVAQQIHKRSYGMGSRLGASRAPRWQSILPSPPRRR